MILVDLNLSLISKVRMRGAEAFEITNKQTYNFNSMSESLRGRKTKREAFGFLMFVSFVCFVLSNKSIQKYSS